MLHSECLWMYLFIVCPLLWACTTAVSSRTCVRMQRSPARPWAAVVTSVTLIRSRISDNHTYIRAYMCMCVFTYAFVVCLLFWVYLTAVCLTLCFSSIQVSLFEKQQVVIPVKRHFCRTFIASVSVRVSRDCLQSTVLESESVECVCVCVYVWVYLTGVWPNIKCLLHMDSTSALYMQTSGHTDVHVQTDRQTQWMD